MIQLSGICSHGAGSTPHPGAKSEVELIPPYMKSAAPCSRLNKGGSL